MQKCRVVKRKAKDIDVNRPVYVFIPSNPHKRSSKFLTHWKGPLAVVEKLSPYNFRVRLPGRQRTKVVHRENMYQSSH